MPKKKSKAVQTESQLKNSLKQLKKLGLYNPKAPRKAPTRYAKSLVKQFSSLGVLGERPKAQVVKVPKSVAKELAGQYRTKATRKAAYAIIPQAGGMSARYSKKEHAIVRDIGAFRLIPYKDRQILLRGGFPKLKKNELSVVVRIGNNFIDFYSVDEVRAAMAEYNPAVTTLWQYPFISTIR